MNKDKEYIKRAVLVRSSPGQNRLIYLNSPIPEKDICSRISKKFETDDVFLKLNQDLTYVVNRKFIETFKITT